MIEARVKDLAWLEGTKGADDRTGVRWDELREFLTALGEKGGTTFVFDAQASRAAWTTTPAPSSRRALDALPAYGSIMGGGRYNELVQSLQQRAASSGRCASIGVDRLLAALLDALRRQCRTRARVTDVLVTTMDRKGLLARVSRSSWSELRAAGLNAEIFLKPKARLGDQLKYASFWKIPYAVILGEDELKDGKITIKDLEEGAKAAEGMKDRADWVEQRPGQFSLDRDKLVETLQQLLGR